MKHRPIEFRHGKEDGLPRYRCSGRGHQMAEFAPALVFLVIFVFVPLLDFGILPIRYLMARELVDQSVRHLAQSETLTQAFKELQSDGSLHDRLIKLGGVQPTSLDLHLNITTISERHQRTLDVIKPRTIPKQWLPDGKLCACNYVLELAAQVDITPAIIFNVPSKIPGLSVPVPCVLRATARWEHRARNPVTKEFYMNE